MARMVSMQLQLHPAVISRLEWEGALLLDGDPWRILGERLQLGIDHLEMGVVQPFWWIRPSRTETYRLRVDQRLNDGLEKWAELLGYPVEVVVHALLIAQATEPRRLREMRVCAQATAAPHPVIPLQDQDQGDGSGMGPYGGSLMKLLREEGVKRPEEFALLLLAREIKRTGRCGGERVTERLRDFARELVLELQAPSSEDVKPSHRNI